MSTVVETSGAQVLPDMRDEQATVTGWEAHCAADADLRARFAPWKALAASLKVHP